MTLARQTMEAWGLEADTSDLDVAPQPGSPLLDVLEGGVEQFGQHPGQPW